MTGISIFKTEKKAFLLSDEGCFCPNTGKLLGHETKAVGLESMGLAFAFSGNGLAIQLVPIMNRLLQPGWKQTDFLEALPAILRDRHSEIVAIDGSSVESRIFVAMLERPRNTPRLYCISSHEVEFLPGIAPFVLAEVEGLAVPAVDFAGLFPKGYMRGSLQDARRIAYAQRDHVFENLQNACGISGDCELLTISRKGIKLNTVASFPDPIGERIVV
jgi:hypothetical protein